MPDAIDAIGGMHANGWAGVMQTNHELVTRGREIICSALGIDEPLPSDSVGSMATIPLPGPRDADHTGDLESMTLRLRTEWRIEVPVFSWRDWPQRLLRISAQLYNSEGDYEKLAEALRSELSH